MTQENSKNQTPQPKSIHHITDRDSVIDCPPAGSTTVHRDARGICTAFGVADVDRRGRIRVKTYELG